MWLEDKAPESDRQKKEEKQWAAVTDQRIITRDCQARRTISKCVHCCMAFVWEKNVKVETNN